MGKGLAGRNASGDEVRGMARIRKAKSSKKLSDVLLFTDTVELNAVTEQWYMVPIQ